MFILLFKRHPRFFLTILIALAILGLVLLYFSVAGKSKILPACVFKKITGLYCPGCGTTRAIYSLIHLDILTAVRCNILFLIYLPLLIYTCILYCVNIYFNKKILKPIIFTPIMCYIVLIIVIVFFILRNLSFWPFYYLAPVNLI